MKKAKTLLGTLLIMLVSIFASACSCGGDGNVTHVYEQDINIRCMTANENVSSTIDDISGELSIECREGDRFVIEYEITPVDTTTTQVNWEFASEGKGAVEPYRRDYSRNKSTKEQVEFEARNEGTTTLTFKTQTLGKEAKCTITVYKPVAELATLVAPTNLRYVPAENALKWNPVNSVYEPGSFVPSTSNGTAIAGLTGYEVVSVDENGGETLLTTTTSTKYEGIEAGVHYNLKVRAVGRSYSVKNSDYTEVYKFYKLEPAINIANNNGEISFTTQDYANKIEFYPFGADFNYNQVLIKAVASGSNYKITYNQMPNWNQGTSYNISTKVFPLGFDDNLGYGMGGTDNAERYFPSDVTAPIEVQRLNKTLLGLLDSTGTATVAGHSFSNVHNSTKIDLVIDGEVSYNSKFGQKFYYEVFDPNNPQSAITSGTTNFDFIDIKDLTNVNPGNAYEIRVWTIGNSENTIQSDYNELSFFIASDMTNANVTLEDDMLVNDVPYSTGGVELFFVHTSDSTKNCVKYLPGDNVKYFALDEIGLTPGTYDVYGKEVAHIGGGFNTAVLVPETFSKLLTITISSNVTNNKITKDGEILFTKINGYDYYEIKLSRINTENSQEVITNTIIANPYSALAESQGLVTYEYLESGFETTSGVTYTARVNLTDIVEYLINNDQVEFNNTNEYMDSQYYLTYQIVTVGDVDLNNGDTVISSIGTAEVTAFINNSIFDVTLNNYEITFQRIGTSNIQEYTVTLKTIRTASKVVEGEDQPIETTQVLSTYVFNPFIGVLDGDNVVYNLRNLTTPDGKKFTDLIDTTTTHYDAVTQTTYTYSNIISVSAHGKGGTTNSPANLNSIPVDHQFEITNKPYSLNMTIDGELSWTTDTLESDIANYNYTIYFYTVTDNGSEKVYTLLSEQTLENILPSYTTRDVVVGESTLTYPVFKVNIGDILKDYTDQVISISIIEHTSDKFNGAESAELFATRISSPVLSYDTTSINSVTHDIIKWSPIDNADVYDISVSMIGGMASVQEEEGSEGEEEGEESTEPDQTPEFSFTPIIGHGGTTFSITDRINHSTNSWGVGTYLVTVSARNSQTANTGTSADNPFVITSVATSTVVNIVSRAIAVVANDNTLSWNNIHEQTNYDLTYILSDSTSETIDLDNATSYDASHFVAGTNQVIVSPSISYKDTGYILIGNDKQNLINKFATAENLGSSGGNFVFKLYGFTTADAPDFELYQTIEGQDLIVSETNYYILNSAPVAGTDARGDYLEYTIVLDGITTGEITLKVKVKTKTDSGYSCLSSDLSSSYTGTKITAVSDLTKVGEWLSWSAQPGVSSYQINYRTVSSNTPDSLILRVDYTDNGDGTYSYTAWTKKVVITGEGEEATSETIEVVDPSIFYFDSNTNKFYHKFDHELFVGDKTGDILFTIRPITSNPGFFSGNTSANTTITKLNANSEISVVNGQVNIADYVADGSATPVGYTINIYMLEEEMTTDPESGEPVGTGNLTYKTDFNGDRIYWTHSAGYTIQDNARDIALIDLNTLSATAVINDSGDTENISFKAEGDYEIEVVYIGDGNSIINSSTIIKSDLDKLATTSLSTADGEVKWGVVDGAEDYTIEVSDGTNTYYFVIAGDTLKGQTLTIQSDEPTEEPSVQAVVDNEFTFDAGVVYTLRVKANAVGKLHSRWSAPFNVKKLYAPSAVTISASSTTRTVIVERTEEGEDGPITVYEEVAIPVNSPIVTWQDSNVTPLKLASELKYDESNKINVPYAGQDIMSGGYKVGTINVYALELSMPVGTYGLQIRAYGNTSTGTDNIGYLNSDYSTPVDVDYIDDVNAPSVSNGVITWTDVKGAYSYKVTAYRTADYNSYIADPENTTLTSVFQTYTTNNTLNLATMALSTLNSFNGAFTFVVNGITNPTESIITTETTSDGSVSVYKPQVLEGYKVKNGMLSWRISIASIKEFVAGTMDASDPTTTSLALPEDLAVTSERDVTSYVLEYIINKVNAGVGENADLEAQITHLLNVNLDINGVLITDTPSEAYVINVTENGDGSTVENKVSVPSSYYNSTYIEYFYDISIEPEIDNSVPEVTPPTPEIPEETQAEVSSIGENTAGVEYVAGKYVVRIAPIGNANTEVAVIGGGYTNTITAYKPNTPITWTTGGADISYGKVQWELSTTQDSTINNFVYYKDYKIKAVKVEDLSTSYVDISVADDDPNLADDYKYYRNLKDDLFTTVLSDGATNVLNYNTNYRLLISTRGTEDSTKLGVNDTIYLNSNACVVNNVANILDTSANVKVQNSELTWDTSNGSTSTKVYIYGPFDNLNGTKTKINSVWSENVTSEILKAIDDVYYDLEGITETDIANYTGKLRIIEFDTSEAGDRETRYSLTNAILDNATFEPGGYIIKMQELGDDKGIVDSVISGGYPVNKLGHASVQSNPHDATVIAQSTGWVGVGGSTVYVWDDANDEWKTKEYPAGSPNQVIGTFVWNPVAGANGYKVDAYRIPVAGGVGELIITEYTNETTYELPSNPQYNLSEYKYYIVVTSIRVDDATQLQNRQFTDNYFSADYRDSTSHSRLNIPKELTIFGTGKIEWDKGIDYSTVGSYRVQFNFGDAGKETEIINANYSESKVPTLALGDGSQNGTIAIAVKAVPVVEGNGYINSSYCTPVSVTRLADPDLRLVDGVFYWGSNGDPVTATELTINGNKQIIDFAEDALTYDTFMKFFTDIFAHDKDYVATNDENIYAPGEYEMKVMFQGTGGEEGKTMVSDENFYIASNLKTIKATKLQAPVIENVKLNVASNSENMVRWELDENAQGYRVRVFNNKVEDGSFVQVDVNSTTILTDNQFLVQEESSKKIVYFKLSQIIEEMKLTETGGTIYVYVQALGSGVSLNAENPQEFASRPIMIGDYQENDMYLSSSYSTPTSIGMPPQPVELAYDTTTGVVSWLVDDPSAYNIKLETNYNVPNVTIEDINNYWKQTSDEFFELGSNTSLETPAELYRPFASIIKRTTTVESSNVIDGVTYYTLHVIDVIRLLASENGNVTPTSYTLTTTGTNYDISVTAMSFLSDTDDDVFASQPTSLINKSSFQLFGKGDGSSAYPYTVSDGAQLQLISKFTNRQFSITNDITMLDTEDHQILWEPILGEFTGVINGNGHTINHFASKYVLNSSKSAAIMTFVETNSGIIMNLNIDIADAGLTFRGSADAINIAPFTITNNGLIYNVSVTGNGIIASPNGVEYSSSVAGIAVTNTKDAQIVKATVNCQILAMDDSSQSTTAGGITRNNRGTITDSTFSGSIKANIVGGITVANNGRIYRSAVTSSATIYVTDSALTNTTRKGAIAGGISARLQNHDEGLDLASIEQCYSLATIKVHKGGDSDDADYFVSGFVASLDDSDNVELKNNYTVVNIVIDADNGGISGTKTINTFYMIQNNNIDAGVDAPLYHNYYFVNNCAISATSSRNDDGAKKMETKTALESVVGALIDGENNPLFVTYPDQARYPEIVSYDGSYWTAYTNQIFADLLQAEKQR